jgi:hypothetical protein
MESRQLAIYPSSFRQGTMIDTLGGKQRRLTM